MDGLTYWWKRAKEAERKVEKLETPKSMFDQVTYNAIREELCCHWCSNIAMYLWYSGDHNPNVRVCDEHKETPYDTHEEGPFESNNRRIISNYFRGL